MKKPMPLKVQRAFIFSVILGTSLSYYIESRFLNLTFIECVVFNIAWAIPLGIILRVYRKRVEKNNSAN